MVTADPAINLFSAILLVGIAQGLFLAIAILAAPRHPDRANRYLAALVAAFALELVFRFAIETGYLRYAPQSLSLHWALDLWFGPVLYLYVSRIARAWTEGRVVRSIGHFVVPALGTCLAVSLWVFYAESEFLKLASATAPPALAATEVTFALAGLVSMVYYLVKSFGVLRAHRRRVAENYSYSERIGLIWLRNLLTVLAVLLALYVPLTVTGWFVEIFDRIYGVSLVLVAFGIGFLGIRQPDLFVRLPDTAAGFVTEPVKDSGKPEQKYQKSALSDSEIDAIYSAITELVDAKRLYLEADLSLPSLADALGLSSHYVSQAINQRSGSNFFDFINKRRVQHVTELLQSTEVGERVNVLNIAMSAGFSSKSAFYTAFRNHMGQSPTQYRKSHCN